MLVFLDFGRSSLSFLPQSTLPPVKILIQLTRQRRKTGVFFFPKLVFQCLFKILFIPVVVHCFSLTHFNVSFADEKSNDDAIFCHGANLQMGDDVFDLENNAEVLRLSKGDWGVGEDEQMEAGSE